MVAVVVVVEAQRSTCRRNDEEFKDLHGMCVCLFVSTATTSSRKLFRYTLCHPPPLNLPICITDVKYNRSSESNRMRKFETKTERNSFYNSPSLRGNQLTLLKFIF